MLPAAGKAAIVSAIYIATKDMTWEYMHDAYRRYRFITNEITSVRVVAGEWKNVATAAIPIRYGDSAGKCCTLYTKKSLV